MSDGDTQAIEEAPFGLAIREVPSRIRVLIADDHPVVREGIRKLLSLEDDVEVVGEAEDGETTVAQVEKLDPDIVLLDLRMPRLDGFAALQRIQKMARKTRVIVITASDDKNEYVQAMKLGCWASFSSRLPAT